MRGHEGDQRRRLRGRHGSNRAVLHLPSRLDARAGVPGHAATAADPRARRHLHHTALRHAQHLARTARTAPQLQRHHRGRLAGRPARAAAGELRGAGGRALPGRLAHLLPLRLARLARPVALLRVLHGCGESQRSG